MRKQLWSGLRAAARVMMATLLLCGASVASLNAYVILVTRDAIAKGVDSAPVSACAIVLGNSVNLDGTTNPPVEERLKTARALYARGRVRRIIVSGLTWGHYSESRTMAAWLIARGVRRSDVVADPGGYRTAATIADAVKLGSGTALIVSQRYHLPRALYFARHAGLAATGVAASLEPLDTMAALHLFLRETAARAEAVLEVFVRGVRS